LTGPVIRSIDRRLGKQDSAYWKFVQKKTTKTEIGKGSQNAWGIGEENMSNDLKGGGEEQGEGTAKEGMT